MPCNRNVLTVAVLALAAGLAGAGSKPVPATNTWKGSVDHEKLAKEMPDTGVITTAKDFEKLVKAWKVADKVPEVNFESDLVLVQRTSGSRLTVQASLDDAGDLKVVGLATRDFGPGFRYVIVSVPKAGVKTVNGKALPR